MSNQPSRRSEQISVRVEPDVLNEVERAAAEERRTVSNLVRNVLADWAQARHSHDRVPA